MTINRNAVALCASALLLIACEPAEAPEQATAETAAENAERERELVEEAVRDAYRAEGAEVTDVSMELSEDGSRYIGQASVRDPNSGAELTVDCRYTTDAGGAPRLTCDRVQDEG